MVKEIKRRMCRFDTAIGTFFKFFVTLGFVMLLGVGCVSASTLVVSKTSPACTSGDEYFTSIQAAVNNANDWDKIVVCPGIYNESVEIDKSVCIQSFSGASDTIVECYDPPNGAFDGKFDDSAFKVKTDSVTINGFTIMYGSHGIFLDGVRHCNILNNAVSSNTFNSITLNSSSNNYIKNNIFSNNNLGIYCLYSFNNTIKHNVVESNYHGGISLSSSSGHNLIVENIVSNNGHGIWLHDSSSNIIKNNIVNTNDYDGIELYTSNQNIVSDNTANSNGEVGIYLFSNSNHNTVKDNTAKSNGDYGIGLHTSNNNIIKGNIANSNKGGIRLGGKNEDSLINCTGSYNNRIENNVASNNSEGILLSYSCNNSIKNNIVPNNTKGISLSFSCNNSIKNNVASSNLKGILLEYKSDNNTIENNIASNNYGIGESGIYIYYSKKNIMKNNIVASNKGYGIDLFWASNNTLDNNIIFSNNLEGVYIWLFSDNNTLYHNNIIDNNIQVRDELPMFFRNYWYHPYLFKGNYWSDYKGTDINGDGIGDTEIPHPDTYYDNYPYINKSGWLTLLVSPEYWNFGTVYQGEIVQKTLKIENTFVYNKCQDDLNILAINSEPDVGISGIELPVKIPKGSSKTFNVTIDTTNIGGYILRSIEIKSDDKITPNKTILIYGFVEPPIQDVRIKNIDFQSRVIKGQISLFNITIENLGDFREKNVRIEFKEGDRSLGYATIENIESNENESAIFKWDTCAVAPKTYDVLIEVKLKHQRLVDSLHVSVKINMPSAAQTLILTNKEKLVKYWGAERTEKLENKVIKLSYHVGVAGIPVYVEEDEAVASAYESWYSNLQDPQEANKVSKHIKKRIDEKLKEYTGIKYIIIVGDDRIIPYYRIHDNTDKPFRPELWQTGDDYHKVNIDSTVGSALRNKMFLTDNIYATDRSMEWKTADVIIPELFVPDVPIGRLIESPEDISAVIAAFYQKEYVNPDKIFVTGYDFLCDSASDCSSTLENRTKGNTTAIISEKEVTEKYFDDIKDELLNTSNNIVLVFQHAEHDLFNIPKYRVGSENITSQNISAATGLNGSIVCSLGCHSGLNVPPNASTDDFDLAQAFAQKGVLAYIAPTSYSIGLQRTIGAHERLISYFTQYLCAGMDVGTALTRAKQEYWATNYDISYIDEQVLETTTLYGLPMARINIPHSNMPYNESGMKIMSFEQGKPDILVISPTYTRINISTMLTLPITYYKSKSGELFLEPNAPVQPKEIRVFYSTPTRMLHGAVLTSAKYTVKSIIPLIDAYMQSPVWIGKSGSPVIDNWCPAQIFTLKSLCYPRAPTESRQYLIVVTGQYKGPTRVTPSLVGREERLYDELSFQLYYASPDEETKPPVIDVSHRINHNVTISVNASDESGIQRVLVTYTDGKSEWESKDLKKGGEQWTCEIAINEISEFFVQAVDNAGNAAVGEQRRI